MNTRTLVVSIDGVAPRFVSPATMPTLCRLARQGASCFQATTVHPSITLPAHTSMLRGIDPAVHGIVDNTPRELSDEWPSFLRQARKVGLSTAALINWQQMNAIIEPDAVDQRYFLDGGYGDDDDTRLAEAARGLLTTEPDVAFAYLVSPDLAGHDHGWGSPLYCNALRRSDAALCRLLELVDDDVAVLVTTDHGGHGHDHQLSEPIDRITFLTLRSPDIDPATCWTDVSILDVAPTVAALAGFEPASAWSGTSLLGSETPIADYLLDMVATMSDHHYGEDVTMLQHSLQTAAHLSDTGATTELALAGLLHDIGHLLGDAGAWGLPDHAAIGAEHLQAWLPASVVEPIRLHVDAKRFLVAERAGYDTQLSEASRQTLAQQGGPFDATEADGFRGSPWSEHAVMLRLADDAGKNPGQPGGELTRWREPLHQLLVGQHPSARALRDSCVCAECRDTTSGQRLLSVRELGGWTVLGHRDGVWDLQHENGDRHQVIPATPEPLPAASRSWAPGLTERHDMTGSLVDFRSDLAETGIAIGRNLGVDRGLVLQLAARLGHVRVTNYGDLFDVRNEPDATNLAYTTLGLPLHTDNPYRDPVPTVQLLHCLLPAVSGGESRFADGIRAAEELRATDPTAFDCLTTTPIEFRFSSADVDLRTTRTMIDVGPNGDVQMVAINHRSMQPLAPCPASDRFYDAYLRFIDLIEQERFCTAIKLEAGEVVAFDNRRVLHARTSFSSDEARHLQGCYVDITPTR